MQGSKDVTSSPFAGSLLRKSSQTTYGRKGRASVAAKEVPKPGRRASPEGTEDDGTKVFLEHDQPLTNQTSPLGSNGASAAVNPSKSAMQEMSRDPPIGVKRKGLDGAIAGTKEGQILDAYSNNKRQRLDSNGPTPSSSRSPPAQASPQSMTPSSDLSDLSSELSDIDTEQTPEPGRASSPIRLAKDQAAVSAVELPSKENGENGALADAERLDEVAPKTPPNISSFLPAIIPSPKQPKDNQPTGLPTRRKARMLSRAESFGLKDAQKDHKEPVQEDSVVKAKGDGFIDNENRNDAIQMEEPTIPVPLTPRRALARSTTLASMDVSPSSKPRVQLTRTASMPTSPAKQSNIGGGHIGAERIAGTSHLGVSIKRTYGRARGSDGRGLDTVGQPPEQKEESTDVGSPMPQAAMEGGLAPGISPEKPMLEQRESYADLVKRLEIDEDEEDQDWEESAGSMDYLRNAKSLAELRSRGENRKLMDDLTWLLDGLNDDSLPVRRSSAIDLLNKMSGAGWFEKLRICGQVDDIYGRLFNARENSTDLGFDLSCLEYLAYVAKVPNALISILGNHLEAVLGFVLYVLQSPSVTFESPVVSAKRKKSPSLQALSNLRVSLDLVDTNDIPLSTSAMAMIVVSAAIQQCISGHIEPPSEAVQQQACAVIAEEAHQQLSVLPERIGMYEKGLDLFSNGTSVDVTFLSDAIDVLSTMVKTWPIVRAQFETRHCYLATDLANLLLIVQFDQASLSGFNDSQALRLLVTPTLTSKDWSKAVLQSVAPGSLVLRYLVDSSSARNGSKTEDSGRIGEEERESTADAEEEKSDLDVSLPLGLLYNLMDAAEDGGQALLLETGKCFDLSVQCTKAKKCIKQCKCGDRVPAVHHLCDLFNRQQDKRNDEPSAAFLAGYLTLLFTKCLQSQACREAILTRVSGSSTRDKINTLQDCLQQFGEVYDSAQSRLQQIMPGEDEIGAERENIMPTIRKGLEMLRQILD